jgi:hypothetical protein
VTSDSPINSAFAARIWNNPPGMCDHSSGEPNGTE